MTKTEQLREALRPYIKENENPQYTVIEGDVESLIELTEYFGYEDIMLQHIKDHPEERFWEFFHVLPFKPGETIFFGGDEPCDDDAWE